MSGNIPEKDPAEKIGQFSIAYVRCVVSTGPWSRRTIPSQGAAICGSSPRSTEVRTHELSLLRAPVTGRPLDGTKKIRAVTRFFDFIFDYGSRAIATHPVDLCTWQLL